MRLPQYANVWGDEVTCVRSQFKNTQQSFSPGQKLRCPGGAAVLCGGRARAQTIFQTGIFEASGGKARLRRRQGAKLSRGQHGAALPTR